MFRKAKKLPEDCEDLQKEVQELEQELRKKREELFQFQRNSLKCKNPPAKHKIEQFVRPEKIILSNDVERLKNDLKLMSMLSGIEVKSYVVEEHCSIIFHMQNDSEHVVKHGMRIEMQSGNKVVSKSSFPLGFNIQAVIDDYDNIMMPQCLNSIWRALAVYYDRLGQFEKLKIMLKMDAQLFRLLDGSHIEITFTARSDIDPEGEDIEIVMVLDYRVYDIRPKLYSFKELDLPEGVIDVLKEQCLVFRRKPLNKAFKEAFITGIGPYKLVQEMNAAENEVIRKHKTFRPNRHNYNNDDTFHPEDCSGDSGDDDDDDEMEANRL